MTKFIYTEEKILGIMQKVCNENNLKLIFLGVEEGRGGYNYGGSTFDSIMLAPFVNAKFGERVGEYEIPATCDNPIECRLATFFHEFSHARLSDKIPMNCNGFTWNRTSRFQYELWVTMIGFGYALENFGIKFSDNTVKWMLDEAYTYYHGNADSYDLAATDIDNKGYTIIYDDWMEREVDSNGHKKDLQ